MDTTTPPAPKPDPDMSDRESARISRRYYAHLGETPLADWPAEAQADLEYEVDQPFHDWAVSEVDFDTCFLQQAQRPRGEIVTQCLTHGRWVGPKNTAYNDPNAECIVDREMRLQPTRAPRAQRETRHLSKADVQRMATAAHRAAFLGTPLSLFVTIAWSTIGITNDAEVAAAMASLTERLRTWSQRRQRNGQKASIPMAYVWVHERGDVWGLHTHLLIHVPSGYYAELGVAIRDRLRMISGRDLAHAVPGDPHQPVTLKVQRPRGAGAGVASMQELNAWTAGRLKYMAKGVDPALTVQDPDYDWLHREPYWEAIGLPKPVDQGLITGKRCGYSVFSLGDKAWSASVGHLLEEQAGPAGRMWDLHRSWQDGCVVQALRTIYTPPV